MTGGHLFAGEPPNQPCDWFYLGDDQTMKLFTSKLKESFVQKFKKGAIHLRNFVKTVAEENFIDLELLDFGAVIYKQTPLFNSKFKNKIDVYIKDFEDYKIKTPELWPYWVKNIDFNHFSNLTSC
jgi:hypothetical protein